MVQFQLDIVRTPSGFFKVCEIAFTIISISICQGTKYFIYGSPAQTFFCSGTLLISMVVTPIIFYTFLVGHSKDMQKTPFEIIYNMYLACSMLSAGSILVHTYCTKPGMDLAFADAGKTAGSFCIINSIFYGVDFFFALQGREVAND